MVSALGEIFPRPAPVEVFENLLDTRLFDGALPELNRILVYSVFLSWLDNEFADETLLERVTGGKEEVKDVVWTLGYVWRYPLPSEEPGTIVTVPSLSDD